MKDSYMVFVLLAVMITPFLPQLLKGKCPVCGKRRLEALEACPDGTDSDPGPYISYHTCKNCCKIFRRVKSGPLTVVEPTSGEPVH